MIIDFRESDHSYRIDGIPVPSVTQVMQSANLVDYSKIPKDKLEAAQKFGTAVHKATELYDRGILNFKTLHPNIVPYLEGWISFRRDFDVNIIGIEKRVGSALYMFAGMLDRKLGIDGKRWIYDIKTAHEDHPATAIQTAGYELADGESIMNRGSILLKPDATYHVTQYKNKKDRAVFLSCLSIHNWKGLNKCQLSM